MSDPVLHATLLAVRSSILWSALSTLLVFVPGALLAYALARCEFCGKHLLSTLVSLPLVLPPTAAGYLLLRLLADNGPLGRAPRL
jgi:molybdate transport system permease protein